MDEFSLLYFVWYICTLYDIYGGLRSVQKVRLPTLIDLFLIYLISVSLYHFLLSQILDVRRWQEKYDVGKTISYIRDMTHTPCHCQPEKGGPKHFCLPTSEETGGNNV